MTDNNYLIYALQSPKGKMYVGQTKDYDTRMKKHKSKDSDCPAIRDAIQEYGWHKFKRIVVLAGLTLKQANRWEEYFIARFDCQVPNGYNLTSGGHNHEVSQITRDKMSATHSAKGDNHPSKRPEVRANMSASQLKAQNRPEVKAKISAANTGDKNSMKRPEVKARHKAAVNSPEAKAKRKATMDTPEWKAYKTAVNSGQNNPMSATNIRRRFIAKCFDGGVFDLKVKQ